MNEDTVDPTLRWTFIRGKYIWQSSVDRLVSTTSIIRSVRDHDSKPSKIFLFLTSIEVIHPANPSINSSLMCFVKRIVSVRKIAIVR